MAMPSPQLYALVYPNWYINEDFCFGPVSALHILSPLEDMNSCLLCYGLLLYLSRTYTCISIISLNDFHFVK